MSGLLLGTGEYTRHKHAPNYAISTSQEQAFEFGTRANIAKLKQGNSIYPFQNFRTPTTYIVSLPNDYLS